MSETRNPPKDIYVALIQDFMIKFSTVGIIPIVFLIGVISILVLIRCKKMPVYTRLFGDYNQLSEPVSNTFGFEMYLFLVSLVLFTSGLWIATQGQTEFPISRFSLITTTLVAGVVTLISLAYDMDDNPIEGLIVVSITYIFFSNIGRSVILQEFQLPFFGLTLVQGGSLGLLLAVFSQPMFPSSLSDDEQDGISDAEERRDVLEIHLSNQWKVGQIALTITVLTIGGILAWTFPNGGQPDARARLVISALSVVITLGPVLGYVFRKIFLIEKAVLNRHTAVEFTVSRLA